MSEQTPTVKTYIAVAQELIEKNPDFYNQEAQDGILSFAKYLDSFKVLGVELQLVAYQKAREIDRELILECCDVFGKENVTALAKKIAEKHRHGKKFVAREGNEA